MNNIFDILKECPLFAGINQSQLGALLNCLSALERYYEKNSVIFFADEPVTSIGIVLEGSAHILREDFWGNRTIIARIEQGGMFGEAFACTRLKRPPVSVFAAESCRVLLIDYGKIVTVCPSTCIFHTGLIKNMLGILANKNVMLTQKMEIITQRTTREKLLTYLSAQARQAGSGTFVIPFNRQELAEYLSVDRSAMSAELSKMQKEGILSFSRNKFTLTIPKSERKFPLRPD